MPVAVKISDRLLARAREEAKGAPRSVTAQIEHWATLGRAVEVMTGHREVLALKRAGEHLAMPRYVNPREIHDVLTRVANNPDRESVKARIRAGGRPPNSADPDHPDRGVQVPSHGPHPEG